MNSELYSLSDDLITQSVKFVQLLNIKTEMRVILHEIITLPDYGQRVILRLDLEKPETVSKIEQIEIIARDISENNYWISFLANTFVNFDFKIIDFNKIFSFLDNKLSDDLLCFKETIHSEQIKNDAKIVKKIIGKNLFNYVREIEHTVADKNINPVIRILSNNSKTNKIPKTVEFNGKICHIETLSKQTNVKGCVKAYVQACQLNVGLHNYIMTEYRTLPGIRRVLRKY